MRLKEALQSLDWILVGVVILLVVVSLAMLFSATEAQELKNSRFLRQGIAAAVALTVLVATATVPYHSVRRYAPLIYLAGLSSLGLVLIWGSIIRGTTSRISLAGFQIQPSEFMKFALIVAVSWFLSRKPHLSWSSISGSAVLAAIPTALIILEPDLGVAVLFIALWAGLMVFAGLRWRAIAVLTALAVLASVAVWQWVLIDYQKARLQVFIDPSQDPLGAGYNVTQSIIAFGSGRLIGRGLGHGPQSQLQFLPERDTDFILASIGEELGFVGVTIVLVLYAIMLWRIMRVIYRTRDRFGQIIAAGVFVLLLTSGAISAGMNIGLLPVTGLPLPLLSYGGSNLLSTCLMIGLVESVYIHGKWLQKPPREIAYLT